MKKSLAVIGRIAVATVYNVPNAKIRKTKKIRSLSDTWSEGRSISPTKELRRLRDGQYLIVDDEKSRHHCLTAAARLGLNIVTRKASKGYEIHRVAKTPTPPLTEYLP